MTTEVPPFGPGEAVKVTFEIGESELHVHGVDFIKLDDTGLLAQKPKAGPLVFYPRERIVMIEGKV